MDLPDALAECRRAAREGYRIANDNLKRIKVDIDAVSADLKQSLASLETEEVWTPDVSDKNDPLAIWHEAFDPKPKKVQTPDVVKQLREQLQTRGIRTPCVVRAIVCLVGRETRTTGRIFNRSLRADNGRQVDVDGDFD